MSDSSDSAALTLAALKERVREYDSARGIERLSNAVVRGGVAGLAFRGVFFLVSSAASKLSRKGRPRSTVTSGRMLKSTLRFAGFLATFSGVYVASDEVIAVLVGKQRFVTPRDLFTQIGGALSTAAGSKAWRSLAAGGLAGCTLSLLDTKEASQSLSIYIFVRGAVLLVQCGNMPDSPPWRRHMLAITRWEHGDALLMCLASSRVLAHWLTTEEKPPSAYTKFLDVHGGKELWVYRAVRQLAALPSSALPARLPALVGTHAEHARVRISCDYAHPGQSCARHSAGLLPAAFLRALPVYLPVYLAPALLVHRRKLLTARGVTEVAPKIAKGVLRSSLFLAVYVTVAWSGICAMQQAGGRPSVAWLALATFPSGIAVLLEKKSRRMELALYVASRAVEGALPTLRSGSGGLTTTARGRHAGGRPSAGRLASLPDALLRRADVAFFAAASAAILHCYSDHYGKRREVFRKPYLSAFDWIFGNQGIDSARIRHAPSNSEYMALLGDSSGKAIKTLSDHSEKAMKTISDHSEKAIKTLSDHSEKAIKTLSDHSEKAIKFVHSHSRLNLAGMFRGGSLEGAWGGGGGDAPDRSSLPEAATAPRPETSPRPAGDRAAASSLSAGRPAHAAAPSPASGSPPAPAPAPASAPSRPLAPTAAALATTFAEIAPSAPPQAAPPAFPLGALIEVAGPVESDTDSWQTPSPSLGSTASSSPRSAPVQ